MQARPVHLQAYSHAWIARPRRAGKALQDGAPDAVTLPPWRPSSIAPADLKDGPDMAEEYCKRMLISVAAKFAAELAQACKLAMAQRQLYDACQHRLAQKQAQNRHLQRKSGQVCTSANRRLVHGVVYQDTQGQMPPKCRCHTLHRWSSGMMRRVARALSRACTLHSVEGPRWRGCDLVLQCPAA
jgi:hypothetical protein